MAKISWGGGSPLDPATANIFRLPCTPIVLSPTTPLLQFTVLAIKFEKQWGVKLKDIELIVPYDISPWWFPPKFCIEANKQQAKNNLDQRVSQLLPREYIHYTDGSVINKRVGAAAVSSTQAFTLQLFLGAASFYTVYSTELVGILGALHLALATPQSDNCQRVIIFTDNQAAIRALDNPERQSGRIIVMDILQGIGLLRSKNI